MNEENMPGMTTASTVDVDRQLARELVDKARTDGVDLVGPDGLLTGLTKRVLETALEEELTDHLGYARHDPVGLKMVAAWSIYSHRLSNSSSYSHFPTQPTTATTRCGRVGIGRSAGP